MKILLLADGSSSHIRRYLAELRRQDCEVTLASLQESDIVDVILRPSVLGTFASYLFLSRQTGELIKRLQPQVINAHFASAYGFAAARCRRRYGAGDTLWALTVWGSDILLNPQRSVLHRWRARTALAGADMTLADSSYLAGQVKALQEDTDSPTVIPWGVSREELAGLESVKSKADWSATKRLTLIAPRPHNRPYRNDLILGGVASLLRQGKARLITCSQGDRLPEFKQLATQLAVSEAIEYYPTEGREEFLKRLGSAQVYLSAASSDSSPVSLIEAMGLGVTPLVASHPGVDDLFNSDTAELCQFDVSADSNGEIEIENEIETNLAEKLQTLITLSTERRQELLLVNRDMVARTAIYEDNIAQTLRCFQDNWKKLQAAR